MDPLRALLVDDSRDDAQLIVYVLEAGGFSLVWERVQTAEDLKRCLSSRPWDIVLSDFSMPQFTGLERGILDDAFARAPYTDERHYRLVGDFSERGSATLTIIPWHSRLFIATLWRKTNSSMTFSIFHESRAENCASKPSLWNSNALLKTRLNPFASRLKPNKSTFS